MADVENIGAKKRYEAKRKRIGLSFSDEALYNEIVKRSKEKGFTSLAEYVTNLILADIYTN